jgi:short-subunit dehydrogenase
MARLPRWVWLSAERVAAEGYEAVMRNQAISIPGAHYKVLAGAVRLMSRGFAHGLGRRATRARQG